MEKIYEICASCKSKVNFEITKQNGILKQYFLNLGRYDYFYEHSATPPTAHKKVHSATAAVAGNQTTRSLSKKSQVCRPKTKYNWLNSLLKLFSLVVIFSLASFILAYNDCGKINEPPSENSTLADLFWYRAEQALNQNVIYRARHVMFGLLGNRFEHSTEKMFSYFNQSVPLLLALIYLFSCLLLIVCARAWKSFNFVSTFLVCLASVALILSNGKEYFNFLKSNFTQQSLELNEIRSVNLGYSVLFVMPVIQTLVLAKLIALFVGPFFGTKKPIVSNKFTPLKHKLFAEANSQSAPTETPPLAKSSLSHPNYGATMSPQESDPVQFNYASVTPKSYTLMKYLESR